VLDQINIKEKIKSKVPLVQLEAFEQRLDYGGPQGYNASYLGQAFPYIVLNGAEIQRNKIRHMEIDCMGFLPKISLTISIMPGKANFFAKSFPRAGDVISVFVRSPNDNIKPIRNDYQIITVNYDGSDFPSDAGEGFLSITGRLFIPKLYDHKTFSIEDTSYSALMKLAEDLSLGFASNVDSTDDKMKWIHMGNYESYIKSIAEHSWDGENSFFIAFVDFYYNLNFVDVNKQFVFSKDGQPGVISDINIRVPSENSTFETQLDVFRLTNNMNFASFNNFVLQYNIINNASLLTYKEGVYKDYSFYDFTVKDIVKDSLVPLRTENAPEKMVSIFSNLGTSLQSVREWAGLQYSYPTGNVHRNYNFASLQNKFNNIQMDKIIVEASLATPNFFVHRGQRLFLEILSYADKIDQLDESVPIIFLNDKTTATINFFLTDFYFVKGHKIIYDPSKQIGFSQEIYLTKREWIKSARRQ
jgi:hypothetical protein